MGLFRQMRIHENCIHHNTDNPDTPTTIATTTTVNNIFPLSPAQTGPTTSAHWLVIFESIAQGMVIQGWDYDIQLPRPPRLALTAAHIYTYQEHIRTHVPATIICGKPLEA
ncbi:unnamed protein product [Schistocephalus solidus]|uniref:Uncharacterized protein n=1 Tax=Schistocephalus solidus TaxID=70667 RepID=A0A183TM27_SCHSO|nr:unnamed protein product [Schistocephalus solidus]